MADRDKILRIIEHKNTDNCGFWKGRPHKDALTQYLNDFSLQSEDELSDFVKDDLQWLHADSSYTHPEGNPMFDTLLGKERVSHSQPGIFANTTSIKEIDNFPWPDTKHIDFTDYLQKAQLSREKGYTFFGGFWSPYFHVIADFFGMEQYFIKMMTEPKIVEAVTEHVVDFYYQANQLLFEHAACDIDVFFFGNDFGTQIDLLISPLMFEQFIYPGIKQLTALAKKHNIPVAMHSCGSIYRIIPLLIDAGIDILHPIQAKAKNMDATYLQQKYKNQLVFMGGLDTQELLPYGSKKQIIEEIKRLKDIFGPNFILSPSHEALLKNVSSDNLLAMVKGAKEL